jgi:3-oxoadipate enol-lactonase
MTPVPSFSTLGSGPLVIMLHGIGGGHSAFAPQLEELASAGYRAVSWDAPGYGRSAPVEPYTFKALAESAAVLAEALMPQNQGQPPVWVGHSMGGMVAQELAARRPDLVRGLVLAGTSAAFGKADGDWQRDFVAQRTAVLDAGGSMDELARQLVPRIIGPGADPAGAALAQQVMASVPQATYRRALQCLLGFDRRANLAQIVAPTLLVAGEFDRTASPQVMQTMLTHMPQASGGSGASWALMKGVGHLMPLEAPDEFGRLLRQFLREIVGI